MIRVTPSTRFCSSVSSNTGVTRAEALDCLKVRPIEKRATRCFRVSAGCRGSGRRTSWTSPTVSFMRSKHPITRPQGWLRWEAITQSWTRFEVNWEPKAGLRGIQTWPRGIRRTYCHSDRNYAASGMVALGSYYAIMDAIRSELGTEGGPPWNPDMATWYPPHVLPFPGRTDRVVCTQMTDYSVTTPGLILYVVLQKVDPDEEKKKKAQRQVVAKPEDKQDSDTQKTKDKQTAQKPKAEDEDDGIGTKVAFGTGGVALTAAAAAYLRKRAIDAAERRALQLAWRKAAEEAAARRAAKVVGEEAAGKVAGKAVVYVEAAAAAALIIFYSDRVEAKPGPGGSPIQSLFKDW